MIKCLSPHYISTNFFSSIWNEVSLRYRLEIYIWDGDKEEIPTNPNYEVTINNVENTNSTSKIDIARLITDFINFKPITSNTTKLLPSPNQVWVKTQVFYTNQNNVESSIPENENIDIAVRGYGYGMDGENPDVPVNKFLLPMLDYTMPRGSRFVVPIKLVEDNRVSPTDPDPRIQISSFTKVINNEFEITFTLNGIYSNLLGKLTKFVSGGFDEVENFQLQHSTSPQTYTFTMNPLEADELILYGFELNSNQYVYSNPFAI